MSLSLPLVLAALVAAAGVAPVVTRALGRDAGWVLGALFVVAFAPVATLVPGVLAGEAATWSVRWIADLLGPGADARLALRFDGLGLLFTVLVLGIGALVLAYTARYAGRDSRQTRTFVLLCAFAAAMLALVLADDVVLLYVGWELTSIVSFLLIAGDGTAGSAPARRAFVVTVIGGLCLLAAVVLLANAAGTTSLSAILSSPAVTASPVLPAVGVLLLVAVGTKSALIPFGFWLRGAMVAPTPISTYLHAATMVKAGIYLLARMTPITVALDWWAPVVVTLGLATAVLGGIQALRATDLKALLAGSTVSQLGFIAATLAVGTEAALVAGLLHTLAHAGFKAALFTTAGVIDHTVHTRDLRELGGLARSMPVTATVATLGGMSMAGVPPLLGFVSKEAVLDGFGEVAPWLLVVVAATATVTVAYTLRFVVGTFAGPRRAAGGRGEAPVGFLAVPAVLAVFGLIAGVVLLPVDALVGAAAGAAAGTAPASPHLALWHGPSPALFGSAGALVGGGLLWALLGRRNDEAVPGRMDGPRVFDRVNAGVVAFGHAAGRPFVGIRPTEQLPWILVPALAAVVVVGVTSGVRPRSLPVGSLAEWGLVVVIAATLGTLLRMRTRLGTATMIGAVGFLVTGVFVLRHAPDLAMTQLLIEALTVVLIVLVFRGLPETFPEGTRRRHVLTGVAAVTTGLIASLVTALLLGPRPASPVSRYYLDNAEPETGGANVVNTILVDFRALDTLGEVTVLLVACIGVYVVSRRRAVRP